MTFLTRTRVLAALGTALTTAALALLVRASLGGPIGDGWNAVGSGLLGLVGLAGLVAAAWQVRSRPAVDRPGASEPLRRAGRYRLVETAPERTDVEYPLAGHRTAELLARAAEAAGTAGSVEAGLAVARPPLRRLARDVLVAGGATPREATRAIETGGWTDDAEAAALLSPAIDPPRLSFRARLRAWLRPERAARAQIDRAAVAVAAAADEALPTVIGRKAPRQVRVAPPTLAELRRDVDGTLRRAHTPRGANRGPGERSHARARDGDGPSLEEGDAGGSS